MLKRIGPRQHPIGHRRASRSEQRYQSEVFLSLRYELPRRFIIIVCPRDKGHRTGASTNTVKEDVPEYFAYGSGPSTSPVS